MGLVKWYSATVRFAEQINPLLQLRGDTEPDAAAVRLVSYQPFNLRGPVGRPVYQGVAGEDFEAFETEDPEEFRRLLACAHRDRASVSMVIRVDTKYESLNCIISGCEIKFYDGGTGPDPDRALADFSRDMRSLLESLGIRCESYTSHLI